MTESAADRLQTSVDALSARLDVARTGMAALERTQRRLTLAALGALAVAVVLAGVFAWAIISNSQATDRNRADIVENNRLLCPVRAIMASQDPPSTTVRGQQIADAMAALARSPKYRCW